MKRTYRIADLFCGAGGSSTGAIRAVEALGGEVDLVAVNHWDVAIATHARNHPRARHYCVNLDAARPEDLVPEGYLDLLMASPECTFFSRARGGKPVHDQSRMSAWHVQRWASTLDIRCLLVENVAEFRDWGPLLPNGRPDPTKKGLYFQAWIQALWAMGYVVDWRLLNAADYGDATTRTRFFLQARKDGKPIRWPEATHSPSGSDDMFGGRPRWRAAREIIDWSNPGRSLLTRKKPLSEKTRRRIARGLEKFGGPLAPLYIQLLGIEAPNVDGGAAAQPFVYANRNHSSPRSTDEPIPTVMAANWGIGLVQPVVEPFITVARENNVPKSVEDPLQTITTQPAMFLVEPTAEPFVLGQQSGSAARSVEQPIPTISTDGAISLVEPMVTEYYGNGHAHSVDDPLPTVTTKDRFGLCSPVVVPYGPRAEARSADEPLPTILTKDRLAVCEPTVKPFIVPQFGERDGQAPRVHDIEQPLPAVTSHGAGALVSPVLIQTDQSGRWGKSCRSIEEPLPTVVAQRSIAVAEPVLTPYDAPGGDPRRLVVIDGMLCMLDIRFRMLTNRELARAMGFDDEEMEYEFTGTAGEITRQIGNAVPVNTATALVLAVLED